MEPSHHDLTATRMGQSSSMNSFSTEDLVKTRSFILIPHLWEIGFVQRTVFTLVVVKPIIGASHKTVLSIAQKPISHGWYSRPSLSWTIVDIVVPTIGRLLKQVDLYLICFRNYRIRYCIQICVEADECPSLMHLVAFQTFLALSMTSTWPQHDQHDLNMTSTWPQYDLNMTSMTINMTSTQHDLNMWPQHDLNMTSTSTCQMTSIKTSTCM